jgi:hypothetical protein
MGSVCSIAELARLPPSAMDDVAALIASALHVDHHYQSLPPTQ